MKKITLQTISHLMPAHMWLMIAFAQALAATLGSLYFSDIVGIVPCKLCWYQRIPMYPLVIMIPMALYFKDRMIAWYGLALSIVGWLIAFYQNVIYYDERFNTGLGETIAITCNDGVPCTGETINWLGFITIPLLSLIGFSILIFCFFMYKKRTD